MLLLFFAISLTNAQQARHDRTELAMYQRIQTDEALLAYIWHPNAR